MNRIGRAVMLSLIAGGLVFVPTAVIHPAHGQTGCSAATLSGPYGIEGSGTIFGAPAAFVGTFVFDGQGKENGAVVLNTGGGIDHIGDIAGDYTLDGGCNGTLVIKTVHHNPPVTHWHDIAMVAVEGGKEIFFHVGSPKDSASASPPPGEVLSGILKRQ